MAEEEKTPQHPEQQQQRSPVQPASKVPRLSSDTAGVVTMAAPSPLMLGLGLGIGAGAGSYRPAFTFMQLQELEHQALIYKYMVAGVPVPLHLVLPIWKSVAGSTYGPHHYPSFMGYGSVCLDYRNSMEPEPGRCRRTDGKKWRCSRDVVPDQKYCERHMHRGRNRSRKPVEAGAAGGVGAGVINGGNYTTATTTTAATATTSTPASTIQAQTSNITTNNGNSSNSTNLSIAIPRGGGLQLMPTAGTTSSGGGSSSSSSNNVSPPRLGFSPTSVLHGGGAACKVGPA